MPGTRHGQISRLPFGMELLLELAKSLEVVKRSATKVDQRAQLLPERNEVVAMDRRISGDDPACHGHRHVGGDDCPDSALGEPATKDRTVFGKPVAHFQNTKFELAACQAEVDAAQAVADRALEALDAGELTPAEAASAKLFCTEVAHRVIDRCLQLHGGYGFINEYPIARLYADNRVNRIYGGTSEVMKMIIAKDMGL